MYLRDIDNVGAGGKKRENVSVDGEITAARHSDEAGLSEMEYGFKDGRKHGSFGTWHDNGQISEESWCDEGKEHGVARQYDPDGNLIGFYEMDHGTGLDFWIDSAGVLSEERVMQDGLRHGYERWWNEDQKTIWRESHYWTGLEHGIFQEWENNGQLLHPYPKYYIHGG